MAKRLVQTKEIEDEVTDRLSNGETMVSIFESKHLPTKAAYNKWRNHDKSLDERTFEAMKRGYHAQADEAAHIQLMIMNGKWHGDPKSAQAAVTAANNLGHQSLAKLSKLDNRYKDRQEVTHTGPMVIGWETDEVILGENMLTATGEDVIN